MLLEPVVELGLLGRLVQLGRVRLGLLDPQDLLVLVPQDQQEVQKNSGSNGDSNYWTSSGPPARRWWWGLLIFFFPGPRASLPASPVARQLYICTDSPWQYEYNGSAWTSMFSGTPANDPAFLSWTNFFPGTYTTSPYTDNTYGGARLWGGVASGAPDLIAAIATPITPTSTMKISLGFLPMANAGIAFINNTTKQVSFLRWTGYQTIYLSTWNISTGAWVGNPSQSGCPSAWGGYTSGILGDYVLRHGMGGEPV